MILGRGLLANAIKRIDDKKYLFYANGISNSVLENIDKNNFEIKEIEEISKQNHGRVFVYFSTSQANSEVNHRRAYVKHKLSLEELIKSQFPDYLIIRTSNLVGRNLWNEHTLFNYLYHAITVNQQIKVNPVLTRNFLDVEHFISLVAYYLKHRERNKIIEIVNPVSYKMEHIVNEFEQFFSRKFNLQKVNELNDFALFELNTSLSLQLIKECELNFDDHIQSLLKKYYSAN
jgi:nucleoside-diphosphate-sugar epimerase